MKQEKILHQNKDTWKPSTKEYKHDPKQGHLETESFIMRQSVFRHQHVEICNSIHQPLETVIPISMGRTLTLWPHGGRPVSLAESLLQLVSLGLSFPPIVFSISAFFTLHENFLLGAVEPPILKKTHEKKNTTNQYPTTSKSWPSLHYSHCRFIIFRSNQCHPVQASPPSNLIRWKNDPALGQQRLFKFLEQVL